MSDDLNLMLNLFKERVRQLNVIDQKAAALVTGNSLLFAGTSIVLTSFSTNNSWAIALNVIQLLLLISTLLALRGVRMLPTQKNWPLTDPEMSVDEVEASVKKLAKIAKSRRRALNVSWLLTTASTLFLFVASAATGFFANESVINVLKLIPYFDQ